MNRKEKLQVFCAALQGLLASGKYVDSRHALPFLEKLKPDYRNQDDVDEFFESFGDKHAYVVAEHAAYIAENASKLHSVNLEFLDFGLGDE
jgi:hypothetical protein